MSLYLGELEQMLLLVILQLNDEAYGVTIRRTLFERAARDVSLATVYTTLDRLEQKGCVTTRMGEPTAERGGRRKRYYRVSVVGMRTLKASLGAIRSLTDGLGREFRV
jgi:DNA-binding PadR family transcriptional regulator